MINNRYTDTVTKIQRLSDLAGTDKEQYADVEDSDFRCHLQIADGDYNFILDGGVKKSFWMWCDEDVDVQQGDKILIDSETYQISSVENYSFGSRNDHKKCLILLPL